MTLARSCQPTKRIPKFSKYEYPGLDILFDILRLSELLRVNETCSGESIWPFIFPNSIIIIGKIVGDNIGDSSLK